MSYLDNLSKTEIETGTFPFNKIIDGAIFYSASGLIPEIIEDCFTLDSDTLAQNIVYCDFQVGYGKKANDLRPLEGYKLFTERILTKEELFPNGLNGDRPHIESVLRSENYPDDNIYSDLYMKWLVFELIDNDTTKKPKRYSIVHIECYGTSVYRSLYYKDELYPNILVIKKPCLNMGNGIDFLHHKLRKIGLHQMVTQRHVLSLPEFVYYVELPVKNEDDGFGWKQYENIGKLNDKSEDDFSDNIYKYKLRLTLNRE